MTTHSTYKEYLDSVADENDFFFIQIGAHTGGTVDQSKGIWSPHLVDPLHYYIKHYNWKGILVEPNFESFEKLLLFYDNEKNRLIFENIAITENGQDALLYMADPSELSSLFKAHHVDGRKLTAQVTTRGMSLNSLCTMHNVKQINLLQIDTEGYDAKLINSFDFSNIKPLAICFEHKHCNLKELDSACNLLKQNNYNLAFEDEFDFLFLRNAN